MNIGGHNTCHECPHHSDDEVTFINHDCELIWKVFEAFLGLRISK
jgi:hypothetical protein